MTSTPTPHDRLLAAAVDTEAYVAGSGWDQPPRLFALVRTDLLAEQEPSLHIDLAATDPQSWSSVEQELPPDAHALEPLLARMGWPAEVGGVALAVERIVVPPEAERDLPADEAAAIEHLAAHPDRADVRLVVAVDRAGNSACALRQRAFDSADAVATGDDLAPGLVAALAATLAD